MAVQANAGFFSKLADSVSKILDGVIDRLQTSHVPALLFSLLDIFD
jgi:hypothetical protein